MGNSITFNIFFIETFPKQAVRDAALLVGTDVHDVLLPAAGEKLTKAFMVELADVCYFDLLILKFIFLF